MQHLPTVLLVDDDPNDTLLFRYAVGESGLDVQLRVVTDGHYAIQYLKGDGEFENRVEYPMPGIVLLDLHMPRLGGLAVLRWIRKQPRLAGLPVVVFTGSAHSASLREAMESGADTYVVKKHDSAELIYLLHQMDLRWQGAGTRPGTVQIEARRA
jgi:CheY-like chemotaxis protein